MEQSRETYHSYCILTKEDKLTLKRVCGLKHGNTELAGYETGVVVKHRTDHLEYSEDRRQNRNRAQHQVSWT